MFLYSNRDELNSNSNTTTSLAVAPDLNYNSYDDALLNIDGPLYSPDHIQICDELARQQSINTTEADSPCHNVHSCDNVQQQTQQQQSPNLADKRENGPNKRRAKAQTQKRQKLLLEAKESVGQCSHSQQTFNGKTRRQYKQNFLFNPQIAVCDINGKFLNAYFILCNHFNESKFRTKIVVLIKNC